MVRCGNCGGALWGRMACISARGQRRRLGQPPRWWWWRGLGQSCRWGRWGLDKRWRWRWGMGQPPWLWRGRCMGQSLIGDFTGHICVAQETNRSLGFLLLFYEIGRAVSVGAWSLHLHWLCPKPLCLCVHLLRYDDYGAISINRMLVSCPRNSRYIVAIKMGRRQGARTRTITIKRRFEVPNRTRTRRKRT